VVQGSAVWCEEVWHSARKCGTVRGSVVWCDKVWHSTKKCQVSGESVIEIENTVRGHS
jgi:hypothetical protein